MGVHSFTCRPSISHFYFDAYDGTTLAEQMPKKKASLRALPFLWNVAACRCPVGTSEDSPALQCWDLSAPKG